MSSEFLEKAKDMRSRAAAAKTEAIRRMYVASAESYEGLAKRAGPTLTASALQAAQLQALDAEVQALHDQTTMLQHALSLTVMLLKRNVPGVIDDLARVQLEPSPDTPPEKLAAVREMTERVRALLGAPAPSPAQPAPGRQP